MKYYLIEDDNSTAFESLGELYLTLEEERVRFCHVESEDNKERYPDEGDAPEGRVKGLVAMKILDLDQGSIIRRYYKKYGMDNDHKE